MPIFFETRNFTVKAHDEPHHSRENGGHLVITPKDKFTHRYEMPLEIAKELAYLTMIVGEAFTNAMANTGKEIARINYQDNGNWAYKYTGMKPQLHVHLYLRTYGEKHPKDNPAFQAFPEALVFPPKETDYYVDFEPLTDDECGSIKAEIEKILKSDKYINIEL